MGYISTMTTPAMMPPRFKRAPITRMMIMPVRFFAVSLELSRRNLFMTASAMVKAAPLSRYR